MYILEIHPHHNIWLKIILEKSVLILVGKVPTIKGLAAFLGCGVGKLPTT